MKRQILIYLPKEQEVVVRQPLGLKIEYLYPYDKRYSEKDILQLSAEEDVNSPYGHVLICVGGNKPPQADFQVIGKAIRGGKQVSVFGKLVE